MRHPEAPSWTKMLDAAEARSGEIFDDLFSEQRAFFEALRDKKVREGAGAQAITVRNGDLWALQDFCYAIVANLTGAMDVIRQLNARVDDLEEVATAQRQLSYRGIFDAKVEYRPGEFCTYGGSLWHCNQLTKDRPGDGGTAWTLAVKRGRDGKDVTR